MAAELLTDASRALDANASPYAGATWSFYATGTTTPQNVFANAALSVSLGSVVTADAGGKFVPIYFDSSKKYRGVLKSADGSVTINDIDPINTGDFGFLQAGTGAVERDMQTKLREFGISVKDFGAVGDGVTDDTASIQKALDTGNLNVYFPAGTYRAANLTMATGYQRLTALGNVIIKKNANGPIITCSGEEQELNGLSFFGDASTPVFTGHNVVSSGNGFKMINCGSRWAYANAVIATGSSVQISGTCDIYQTADATANGWDIVIGTASTATLYHHLSSIRTGSSAGGIKLIATGKATIVGCQFGKFDTDPGNGPGGSGGPSTLACRINGAVTVRQTGTKLGSGISTSADVTIGGVAGQTISSIARTSAVLATVTTVAPHGLITGDLVSVQGVVPATFVPGAVADGFNVVAQPCTVTGANTFTYVPAGDPGSAANVSLANYAVGPAVSGIGVASDMEMGGGTTFTIHPNVVESTFHLEGLALAVTLSLRAPNNDIWHPARTYTSSLMAYGGSPSLGNGTLTTTYVRKGRSVRVDFNFIFGSTTNMGATSTYFSLPVPNRAGGFGYGSGRILDSGVGYLPCMFYVGPGASVAAVTAATITGAPAGNEVNPTTPITFATGDAIQGAVEYSV